jgi:vacuolar-type H+-ATPase subunit H
LGGLEMDNTIRECIERLASLTENAKTSMLSSSNIMIPKDEIEGIIYDMRLNLPSEIKQANRIVNNTTKIINEATANADLIIKQARDTADKMVMEHEIVQQAKAEADAIVYDAMAEARAYRVGSLEYADDMLRRVEEQLRNNIENFIAFNRDFVKRSEEIQSYLEKQYEELYKNRMDLRKINEGAENLEKMPPQEEQPEEFE